MNWATTEESLIVLYGAGAETTALPNIGKHQKKKNISRYGKQDNRKKINN